MEEITRYCGNEIRELVDKSPPSISVLRAISHSLFVDGVSLVKIGFFLTFTHLMIEKYPQYKTFLCEHTLKMLCEKLKFD